MLIGPAVCHLINIAGAATQQRHGDLTDVVMQALQNVGHVGLDYMRCATSRRVSAD